MAFNGTFSGLSSKEAIQDPSSVRHHGHHSSAYLSLTLAHILLALWTWLANITQVVNLLLDAKLRRQPRSVLIVSISVSDLLVAGFLCPLYADGLVRGPWRHGLLVCSLYEVVFYVQVCISSLAVLVLNVERFYFLLAPRLLQAPAKRHVTALLTSLPWLVSVIVVVPLFTRGAHATLEHVVGLHHRTCVVEWERTLHIVTIFVAFLAPAFLLLATAVAVLLLYVIFAARATHEMTSPEPTTMADSQWNHSEPENAVMSGGRSGRRRRHFSGLQELDTRTKRECVMTVCASSFLSVGLHFPFFALLLLQQFCSSPLPPHSDPSSSDSSLVGVHAAAGYSAGSGNCHQFSDTAWATCMMLGMAKPGVLPIVWLLYSDIRAGFRLRACRQWSFRYAFRTRSRAENEDPASACPSQPSLASQTTVV